MNKKFFVFTVLAASAAVASAQSNVAVYGVVDAGLVRESGGAAGAITKVGSGVLNGSRLGFKGREDLGGGLAAVFVLESGFLVDTGAMGQGGLLFGRQAFVGLTGDFGSVSFGRQYSAIDSVLGSTDPFKIGLAGRQNNVVASTYVARVDNSLYYKSPTVGGFAADVIYGLGEVAGNSSAKRYAGGSLWYTRGALYARLAQQRLNNASASGAAKITMLAGTYDFGAVKAHLSYAASKTDAAGATTLDNRDVMAGVSLPFGASTVMASYIRKHDNMAAGKDSSQAAIGYMYDLSKRTALYAAYSTIHNSNGATYTVGNASDAGSGNRAVNLGLRHFF